MAAGSMRRFSATFFLPSGLNTNTGAVCKETPLFDACDVKQASATTELASDQQSSSSSS